MEEWLRKCNRLRRLDFEPKVEIHSIIKENKGYRPISFPELKEEFRVVYRLYKKMILIKNL